MEDIKNKIVELTEKAIEILVYIVVIMAFGAVVTFIAFVCVGLAIVGLNFLKGVL